MFLKLEVHSNAKCAAGYTSWNGNNWKKISEKCFDAPLSLQGLASASHDGGPVRFLYGNVTRNGKLYQSFPNNENIGDVRQAIIDEGKHVKE